jgi:hypothetical protein
VQAVLRRRDDAGLVRAAEGVGAGDVAGATGAVVGGGSTGGEATGPDRDTGQGGGSPQEPSP